MAGELSYILLIAMIKASILAFFLRIFPDERFRRLLWGTFFFNLLVGVLYFTLVLVQRQPIWLSWEGWKDKEPRGVILDLNDLGLAHGGTNVALDVWMLVVPFTQLYKLKQPLHKKLSIFAMFSVGVFLTIAAAIRINSLVQFATTTNVTNDITDTIMWSCIEVCVGVSVACMPHARQLVREASKKLKRAAPPDVSMERPGRLHYRPPRTDGASLLEPETAVGCTMSEPEHKSWYDSTTHDGYTTTRCTSDRQPSSFASQATTRVGSIGQTLDEATPRRLPG